MLAQSLSQASPDAPESAAERTWLVNTWYAAAASSELGQAPLSRRICNQPMVFYRSGEGRIVGLEDFCPHRGAPLSLGVVRGSELVCGYHGLAIGCDGKPTDMPNQNVSRFQAVKSFPVVERYGFIWVWPGDPALATAEALPDLFWAESPEWAFGGGVYHVACDYRLMVDNLMDLTHETYVHATSIGQREIDETPVETVIEGEEVITHRFMEKVGAPPFWRMILRQAGLPEDEAIDRWQSCRFSLPNRVLIDVGVAVSGAGGPDAPKDKRASAIVVDFATPETETSHWYFWGFARNFAPDDDAFTDTVREGQGRIFGEDIAMLERQQQNLSVYADRRRLMTLNIDAGGAHARRMIDKAIQAEHGLT